jgi:hypothetical protein
MNPGKTSSSLISHNKFKLLFSFLIMAMAKKPENVGLEKKF